MLAWAGASGAVVGALQLAYARINRAFLGAEGGAADWKTTKCFCLCGCAR
jgi:hypothetical protein